MCRLILIQARSGIILYQYYHNRNITIKPTNINLSDSASVRFYFLDSETESLINATGCGSCSKPSTAYELGVSKYSEVMIILRMAPLLIIPMEPGCLLLHQNVNKVPFDKGYYAEFKVKDFSEFWLNNGGVNNNKSLPVELVSFTAKKKDNNDVLVEWVTASENNIYHYEVELAKGNAQYKQNQFVKIGEVNSKGNSTTEQQYNFIDIENNKSGIRYYRLKIIDNDGRFTYSPVRPVVFNEEVKWQVYPNPSSGIFNFVYQASIGYDAVAKVYDLNGKQILQMNLPVNGFIQKSEIDLSHSRFTAGMYLLEVTIHDKKQVFRLIKQ